MKQESTITEHYLAASSVHLNDVLDYVDDLHSAAGEGRAERFAEMSDTEVINTLRDMIYTAQETIRELEAARAQKAGLAKRQTQLRIVK